MFDWFGNVFRRRNYITDTRTDLEKIANDMSKVIPPMPEVNPPKEEPAKVFYRLGLSDNNRVSFSMGYNEILMNRAGVQQMINQLEFFKSQLIVEQDDQPEA